MSTTAQSLNFDHGADDHSPELYTATESLSGVATLDDVTDADIDGFIETGFLVVEQAFNGDEVTAAVQGLLDLIMGRNPDFTNVSFEAVAKERAGELSEEERQDAVRKLMSFCAFDQRLEALSRHPKLWGVIERMLKGAPKVYQEMALIKPPYIGREKPWHQDHAYFKIPTDSLCIGVWIALDETTPENGCMHIMPHMFGEPVHHFQRRDWQICDSTMLGQFCHAVPLKPGGCLFFSSLLPHGTPTNRSDRRRRALQFHYVREDVESVEPDFHKSLFGGEYSGQTC